LLCLFDIANYFFHCLKAVFIRDASFGQDFKFALPFFLALKKLGDVALEQVELALEVDPASDDKAGKEYKLNYDRQIDLSVQVPGFYVVVIVHFSYRCVESVFLADLRDYNVSIGGEVSL